ncbi:MAG: M3 family metallopeptidase [Saprospiraceae bacterium]
MNNPFLVPFNTPYGVPPFDIIQEKHFIPAIKAGMKEQKKEIKSIISNVNKPDFENTILPLEHSGQIIRRTVAVLYNLSYANTSAPLQDIMQKVAPSLSAHNDYIFMNTSLIKRVKYIWDNQKSLHLKGEKFKLLELYYKTFVRNGANLKSNEKRRVAEINQKLSLLSLQFGKNILDTINDYKLTITDKADLAGLTEDLIAAASDNASKAGHPGKWIFTLQNASVMPFLQYSDQRSLRQTIWEAYTNKGNNGDDFDNNNIVSEIIKLRAEKANILGYSSHAHYVLEEQMAKSPDQVYDLLNKLWSPAIQVAKAEAGELQQMIRQEGHNYKLKAWDWRYYAEKLRKQKYDLDEVAMKPYFSLHQVQNGVFDTAKKLYGLSFVEVVNLPVYHQDVKAYEVTQNGNKKIGILYLDFFPRDTKQGGAWMTSYVSQDKTGKKRTLPVISIVCNFTKPVGNTPSLLTFDEVNTFFHEFGHALHGLLSDVTYHSLAGTNVPTDFVELPSQILENWCAERDVLKTYAFHYKTGESIPDDLITKMDTSSKYGQGFATVEYLAACMLDMGYHTLKDGNIDEIQKFEKETLLKIDLIEEIISRYRSTYFSHIFAGGYSSGYYSYIWSEVLDADAFSVFKTKGLFDKDTADSFRKNILERGGSADPMKLYIKFRGKKPDIGPLLDKRGLVG